VFEEYLLDADWALNAGNWMWLSASAFFHQFFRVYSPVAFGKKTDPDGLYIKKYVPELKNYPSGAIYEPWKVGKDVQKKYGCVVGVDYPNRLVIHEDVHKENIAKLSVAYKKNKAAKETGKTTKVKKEQSDEDDSSEEEVLPAKKRKAPGSKDTSQVGAMKKYLK
jgi:cryptochrome